MVRNLVCPVTVPISSVHSNVNAQMVINLGLIVQHASVRKYWFTLAENTGPKMLHTLTHCPYIYNIVWCDGCMSTCGQVWPPQGNVWAMYMNNIISAGSCRSLENKPENCLTVASVYCCLQVLEKNSYFYKKGVIFGEISRWRISKKNV